MARVACLQFNPILFKVNENKARADALLASQPSIQTPEGRLDLLVLPECAFTGYCFESRDEILPFCESTICIDASPSLSWLRSTAIRLSCIVAGGFPELAPDGTTLYNSVASFDASGTLLHVHRKVLLYTTDETWASEGPSFDAYAASATLNQVAHAICMDLSFYKFMPEYYHQYRCASAMFDPALDCLAGDTYDATKHRLRISLLIASNAWLRSNQELGEQDVGEEQETAEQLHLVNYWCGRLRPLVGLPVVLVLCNRVGCERGTTFAGTSCVVDLQKRKLLGLAGIHAEELLIVDNVPIYSNHNR
jgi:protein N-terminal amidase